MRHRPSARPLQLSLDQIERTTRGGGPGTSLCDRMTGKKGRRTLGLQRIPRLSSECRCAHRVASIRNISIAVITAAVSRTWPWPRQCHMQQPCVPGAKRLLLRPLFTSVVSSVYSLGRMDSIKEPVYSHAAAAAAAVAGLPAALTSPQTCHALVDVCTYHRCLWRQCIAYDCLMLGFPVAPRRLGGMPHLP